MRIPRKTGKPTKTNYCLLYGQKIGKYGNNIWKDYMKDTTEINVSCKMTDNSIKIKQ